MLQSEFEAFYGKAVTVERYREIEEMYMACQTLDKQEFTEQFKKMEKSPLLWELFHALQGGRSLIEQVTKANDKQKRELETYKYEHGTWLLNLYHSSGSEELRDKALAMLGRKAYVKYIISSGWALDTFDREQVIDEIDNN